MELNCIKIQVLKNSNLFVIFGSKLRLFTFEFLKEIFNFAPVCPYAALYCKRLFLTMFCRRTPFTNVGCTMFAALKSTIHETICWSPKLTSLFMWPKLRIFVKKLMKAESSGLVLKR